MCGRFVSSSSPDKIAEYFDASFAAEPLPANFNVAPTNDVYGVVATPGSAGEEREVQAFHWGLVPTLGEGHQDLVEADQRPLGDDRREAGVPQRRSPSTG